MRAPARAARGRDALVGDEAVGEIEEAGGKGQAERRAGRAHPGARHPGGLQHEDEDPLVDPRHHRGQEEQGAEEQHEGHVQHDVPDEAGVAAHADQPVEDQARGREQRRGEEDQGDRAQHARDPPRLDDAPEGRGDVALVHGEVLGELPDDQILGLPGGEHEAHHGDADEDQRDEGHEKEEGEARAEEEAVGGPEA